MTDKTLMKLRKKTVKIKIRHKCERHNVKCGFKKLKTYHVQHCHNVAKWQYSGCKNC